MASSGSQHIPVLPAEAIQWLQLNRGDVVVDGTLGRGGHTRLLLEAVGESGRVIALDRDPAAIAAAESSLGGLGVQLVCENYCHLPAVLASLDLPRVHAILLDLGLSSDQLADQSRGFSFESDGPLDLRFNPDVGEPATRLIERLGTEQLANLIYEFGEERFSRRVARRITETRRQRPIRTARDLATLVRGCVPRSREHGIDPATRTFQALRIAVNEELQSLDQALAEFPECLLPGGRLAVISFHSLEDRRVKLAFRGDPRYDVLTKKPVRPGAEEVRRNSRSRSAKLRVASRKP